tara:strand:+ start:586 stop:900 length:315 start_codon:yes stop_codon:yes gene_type:complete
MNKIEGGNSANLTNRGRGRPKGAVNKATKAFRDTVNDLLEGNAENVSVWLQTVAYGDGDQLRPDPKGALDILSKLAEFATPKLARTEHSGTNNEPIEMKITWMK